MRKRLERAYAGVNEADPDFMPKSLNYIKPSIADCIVWANRAWEKLKQHKEMLRDGADKLYVFLRPTEI